MADGAMALTEVVGRRGGMASAGMVKSPWVSGIRNLAAFGREGTCEPIGQHDAEETFGSKPSGAVLSETVPNEGVQGDTGPSGITSGDMAQGRVEGIQRRTSGGDKRPYGPWCNNMIWDKGVDLGEGARGVKLEKRCPKDRQVIRTSVICCIRCDKDILTKAGRMDKCCFYCTVVVI